MRAPGRLLLALLACACLVRAASPLRGSCAEGCHLHGTCHAPLGRCDCPRYFAGADCSLRATPSCLVDAALRFDSGCRSISTCACVLECEAAGFRPLEQGQCFNYSAATPSLDAMIQSPWLEFGTLESVYPGMENSGVSFESGPWALVTAARPPPWRYVPLSQCADSCSHAGYCRRNTGNGATQCVCLEERGGDLGRCEVHTPKRHCLGACSGRGECVGGFCHCQRGAYGADCSLTGDASERLFWDDEARGEDAQLRPRIYVYTLPPRFNAWYGIHAPGRDLGVLLHERLLSSRYRTADPDAADFFYVPTSPMGPVNHNVAVRAAEWVAAQYPYWNRSRGADHVYAFPWDFGSCWVGGHPMLSASVFVSHFGLDMPLHDYACACPACAPSYRRGKDVVLPDALNHIDPKLDIAEHRGKHEKEPQRTTFLFFAGSRTGPAREALFNAKLAGPGVRIVEGEKANMASEMLASVFCISAPGSGFGTRFALAVYAGCIPVSFVDAVREPLDDVVDIEAISVRIPQERLADIVPILRNVSAADVAAMQAALKCVRPHFVWSSAVGALEGEDGGADAFEAFMFALRRRVAGPLPLLSCATGGRVPGAPKPLREPCAWGKCVEEGSGRHWPAGGAACGPANQRPC